jgi:hypothetical protein
VLGVPDDQVQSERELSVRELNAMIPRKVRLDPDQGQTIIALALILFAMGAIWFGIAFNHYFVHLKRQREALNRDGQETVGTITRIYTAGRRSGTMVGYAFRVDGSDYHDSIQLGYEPQTPDGDLPYLRLDEPIRVQYLPSDPRINHPTGWAWWSWWNDVFPNLFALLFPGGGVSIAVNLYRERRLARIGWVTEAKVIACAPKGSQFRVDYEFYDENHQEFDGANEHSEEYESDANIRVIYLKKDPKRNAAYPMSTFHTVGE